MLFILYLTFEPYNSIFDSDISKISKKLTEFRVNGVFYQNECNCCTAYEKCRPIYGLYIGDFRINLYSFGLKLYDN